MRIYVVIAMICVMLNGCMTAFRSSDVQPQTDEKIAAGDEIRKMLATREPLTGKVSQDEAMARAIKALCVQKAGRMDRLIAAENSDMSRYDLLPGLTLSAGYATPQPVPEEDGSPAQPRSILVRDLATVWDVLDLGISYARIRQSPRTVTEETRRKSLHNILEEIRYAYYRAAGAEALLPEIQSLTGQIRAALAQTDNTSEARQEQLGLIRTLWQMEHHLAPAKTELGILMNLPPGTQAEIEQPDWRATEVPPGRKSPRILEYLTLAYRPEVREIGSLSDTRVFEAGRGLLKLNPAAESAENNYSRDWWNTGVRLSLNLFQVFATPDAYSPDVRRLTTDMAAMTQLHVALQRYRLAVEDVQALNAASEEPAEKMESFRQAVERIQNRFRRYAAYAELENAAARIYNSLGIDPLPEQFETMTISALSRTLRQSVEQWGSLFDSAYVSYGTEKKLTLTDVAKADTPAAPLSPEKDSPPSDRITAAEILAPKTAPELPQAPVQRPVETVNAADAAKDGRTFVRKVEIFRDVVNIQSQPSYQSSIMGQGLIGEHYKLLGWSPGGWLRIEMNDGESGWIPTRFIRPVDEPEPAYTNKSPQKTVKAKAKEEKTAAPVAKTPRPAPSSNEKEVVTRTRANVRSGPGFDFRVMFTTPQSIRYTVWEKSGEWYKIRDPKGGEGWLHKSIIVNTPESGN